MSARGIDRAEIDRIAARINGMYRNRPEPRPSVTRGTVQAAGEYTYDVLMPDGAVLLGVKRTVGAGGASVGDECLIEWIAGSAYVTGVVATADSSHCIKCVSIETTFAGRDKVYVTAPKVDGYQFVCWVATSSIGWVGLTYIDSPEKEEAIAWTDASGALDVKCTALYVAV